MRFYGWKSCLVPMIIATASNPVSAAQTDSGASDQMLWAFLLAAPPVGYACNKWWYWGMGFRFGAASGSGFLSALKWSLLATLWVAIVMGLAWITYQK